MGCPVYASRLVVVALCSVVLASCDVVVPTNPFDPEAPPPLQAPGSIAGTILLSDSLDETTRLDQLNAIRVGLLGADGRRVQRDNEALAVALKGVDALGNSGTFFIDELVPGTYGLIVDGVPTFYAAPTLPTLEVIAGGVSTVDPLKFTYVAGDNEGPGRIHGEVRAEAGALGAVQSTLYTRRTGETTLVRSVVGEGAFDFTGLSPGYYAVVVESDGFTPAYRLDVHVGEGGDAQLDYAFTGDANIVVHPVSAVLLPKIPSDGLIVDGDDVLLRRDDVPLAVLSFSSDEVAGIGVTGMRLSTAPTFLDDAGAALPFSPYTADATVAVPPVDGPVSVYAQFEARSAQGFAFTSSTFSIDLVRDTTPPSVVEAQVLGLSTASDGAYLSPVRQVTLRVDGTDATSGVAALRAGFDSSESVDAARIPGQQRLQKDATAASDGRHDLTFVLVDRAGNETAPQTIPVIVDTLLPDIALAVGNASGGFLPDRVALLNITSNVAGDDGLLVAVGLEGSVDEGDLGPIGERAVFVPAGFAHGTAVTFEVIAVDAVGNESRATQTVTLDLRGAVSGLVETDDIGVVGSVAGATVTLADVAGTTVDTRTLDATGAFVFSSVPEGRGYAVTARLAGHGNGVVRNIVVDDGVASDVDTMKLPLLRGEIRGTARRGDVLSDNSAHSGIQVAVRLVSTLGRVFQDNGFTDPAGNFTVRGVPQTLAGETLRIEASAVDYGAASSTTTLLGPVVDVGGLLLPRGRGDFDVCASTDPICAPLRFVRGPVLDIRLRDAADVVALLVTKNAAPTQRLSVGAANRTPIDISGDLDGELSLTVVAEKSDGSRSDPLTATLIKDTTPPTDVDVTRFNAAAALDGRFTSAGFVDIVVAADAGTGLVAPLAPARVVVDEHPADAPAAGFAACAAGEPCRVALPGDEERRFDVVAFACDAAGNCAAPVETFVIRDVTPPSLANDASFAVAADGSVVEAGVRITPTPLYRAVVGLGHATTLAGVAVTDESDAPVADVFGVRLALSSTTLSRATMQTFAEPPVVDDVRAGADIEVPALANVAFEQTVFAQFVDAAGNVSDAQLARLQIDTSPPVAIVALNGGAPTSAAAIPFSAMVPAGAEAPTQLRFVVDDLAVQSFAVPLSGLERLTLPALEGPRAVTVLAVDRVGNVAASQQTVLRDTSAPTVLAARCVSSSCVDAGFGQIVTNAADGRVDLVIETTDAFTSVASVRVTFSPPLGGAASTQTFSLPANGRVDGVLVPTSAESAITIVPVDVVGNVGAGFTRALRHDVTGPTIASIVVEPGDDAAGAVVTNKAVLTVAIDVPAGDAVSMRLSSSTSFSGAFSDFAARTSFAIAGADGPRQVCVQVRDAGGNTSFSCDTIELDRTVPQGSVAVDATVTRASSTTARLTMPADTVRAGATASGVCTPTTTTPPIANVNVVLGAGDGPRTILACFEDAAGNTASASTSLAVDRTPPAVALSLPGTFSTTSTTTASLQASADANALAVVVDGALDCAQATYEPFSATKSVTLGADGAHTVRACVRDPAGNVSATAAVATIVVDTTRPTVTAVLNAGAEYTRSALATVSLQASADVVQVAVANASSLNCATANFVVFQPTMQHTLTAGDGVKNVSVCVKDAAGLVSASSALATINVDTTPPTGTLLVAGGAATTSISPVAATLSFDADVVGISLTSSPTDQACSQAADAPATATTVSLLPNTNNVVMLCLLDRAGNLSAPIRRSIFFESAAGAELVIAIDGGAATIRRRTNVPVSLFRPSTDFDQMKVAEGVTIDCTAGTGYVAFAETVTLPSLTAGSAPAEGVRTVSACIRKSTDTTQTKAATDTIFVDSFAPDGTITVNGAVTSSPTVTAQLVNTFGTEVLQVALSETSAIGSGGDCNGSFEAFASSKTFTFSPADGTRTLFACLRDQAGNTREVQDAIVLDTTPPSPVALSVPALVGTQTVSVGLTFPVDATEFVLGEGSLECSTAQGFVPVPAPPSKTFSLSAVDGAKIIVGCFRDAAGNTSQAAATVTLDRTKPTGVVVLDGGAAFSTDLNVSVAVTGAVDAVRMARVESSSTVDCEAQSYVAFVSPLDFTVSAADGPKTVQVCLEDAAGNRALAVADTIVVDRTAPNGTVVVNDGAAAASSRNVTLSIGAGVHTDIVSFAAAEGAITCNAANLAYQPFATQAPFLLSSTDATKTVLVCLRDQAGNVSTVAAQDTIALDTAAPVGASVVVNDGDGFLQNETTIGVTLGWTTSGDVAAVKLGEGGADCQTTSGYVAVSGTSSTQQLAVSSGDGTKLAFACLKDAAGNISTAQDTTLRDTTAPVVTSLVCSDCVVDGTTVLSSDATVVLAVAADESGSGLASARVAVDAGVEASVALVNGALTVGGLTTGVRTLRVKLVDRAGNTSVVARDIAITVDNAAPTLDQLLVNGSNAVDNATRTRLVTVTLVASSSDLAAMAVADVAGTSTALASCATATYAPFVAEFARTLTAGDGDKTISVCLQDRAGNRSAAPVNTTIRLDTVGPSLVAAPVLIQDGDGFLQAETSASVVLAWTTNGDARRAKLAEGLVDCGSDVGYVDLPTNANTTTISGVAFSAGDGAKTLSVCFRDLAGNAVTAQDVTVRDGTAPTVTALACAGCAQDGATTLSTSATLSLAVSSDEAGSGVQDARVAVDGGADATIAVNNGVISLGGLADGARSLRVKLRDRAGNLSSDAQAKTVVVVVDTTRPDLAAGGLKLNGAASGGATNNAVVTATLSGVPTDAVAMSLVEAASAPSCTAASYVPLAMASPFSVSTGAQGTKTVFVCLRDRAGNTSSSATSATITFDTVPPSLVATPVVIQDGDGFLQAETTVDVLLRWTTNGDVAAFKLGEGGVDCSSGTYEAPSLAGVNQFTRSAFPVSTVDGSKTIFVCFRDLAGNVTTGSDTTTRDQAGPSGALLVNADAAFTTSEDVTVALRMEQGTARFALAETTNPGCTTATLNCAQATFTALSGARLVDGLLVQSVAQNLNGAPATQGEKCFEACFEDAAGNRTTTATLDAITFDSTRPTLTALAVNGGVATTRERTVAAVVTGASADVAQMALATTTGAGPAIADCATASYVAFAATSTVTLPASDGQKAVSVCLKDVAGNVSAAATTTTLTLDATPPQNAGVTINNGDARTRSTSATLSLSLLVADQATTQIQVATDGVPDTEAFEAFVATRAVTLPSGDGTKTVIVRFRDAAGNELVVSDGIELDTTPPSGGTVVINGGAAVTNNTTVTLTLSPPSDAVDMSIGGGSFVAVSTTALTSISAGDCIAGVLCKSVSVVFRDAAGNAGTAASDTIELDTTPPVGGSLLLASSTASDTAGFSTSGTVTASFAFTPGAGQATQVKHGEGAVDCGTASGYVSLGSTSPLSVSGIALSAGDAQKTYVACFKDAAGNVASATSTIFVDRTRPFGVITLNDGAAATTSENVTVDVIPASDDATKVAFVNAAAAPDCSSVATASFAAVSPTMAHTLALGDGTKTVFACFKDNAGNVSTLPISDQIALDKTAPTVAVAVAGNATADVGLTNTLSVTATVSISSLDVREIALAEGTLACATASYEPVPTVASLQRTLVLANTGDGARTISVCARDNAGNTSGVNGATANITVDTTPPQVALTIAGGATTTTTANSVTLASTPPTDALRFVLGVDPAIDCSIQGYAGAYATLPATTSTTLTGADGEKFVAACFQDRAGNVARFSDSIVLDTRRPQATFSLAQGAAFTTTTTVSTDFSNVDSDVVSFSRGNGSTLDCAAATYTAFVTGTSFTLTSGNDGSRTVAVCLKDTAGNTTLFTDAINLDQTNPSVAFALARRGTASPVSTFTNTRDVTLTVSTLSSDAVAVAVANASIDCGTVSYETLPQPLPGLPFTRDFALGSGVDGTRTVAVCVKDAAGRTNGTTGTAQTITLDTAAPVATLSINAGAQLTNNATVTLGHALTSTPASEPVRVAFSTVPAVDCNLASFSGAFAALGASSSFTLQNGVGATDSGTKFAVGCFQDQAGNIGTASDDIVFDEELPLVSSLSCSSCNVVDGVAFTNGASNFVNLVATSQSPDVDFALTMVTNDAVAPFGEDRVCTSAANCNSGETCAAFPVDQLALPTTALRCQVATPIEVTTTARVLPVEGSRSAMVALQDTAGNFGPARALTVVRDTVVPTTSFSLTTGVAPLVNAISTIDDAGTGGTLVITFASPHRLEVGDQIVVSGTDLTPIDYDGAYSVAELLSSTSLRTAEVDPGADDDASRAGVGQVTADFTKLQSVFVNGLTIGNETAVPNVSRIATFQASSVSTFADASTLSFPSTLVGGRLTDSIPVTLTAGDGGKKVFVKITDNAGNTTTTQIGVNLDATLPTDPQLSNANVLINDAQSVTIAPLAVLSTDKHLNQPKPYTVTGLADPTRVTNAAVTCTTASCAWTGTGSFTVPASAFGEGDNRVRVVAGDVVGNVSNADFVVVTVDKTAPNPVRVSSTDLRSGSVTMTFAGDPSVSTDLRGLKVFYGDRVDGSGNVVDGNFADQGASPLFLTSATPGALPASLTLTGLVNLTTVFVQVVAVDQANLNSARRGTIAGSTTAMQVEPAAVALANLVDERTSLSSSGSLAVRDGRLYTVTTVGGVAAVCAYDVTDPTNPVTVTTNTNCLVDGTNISVGDKVRLHGRFLYLTRAGGAVRAIDISNPAALSSKTVQTVFAADIADDIGFLGRDIVAAQAKSAAGTNLVKTFRKAQADSNTPKYSVETVNIAPAGASASPQTQVCTRGTVILPSTCGVQVATGDGRAAIFVTRSVFGFPSRFESFLWLPQFSVGASATTIASVPSFTLASDSAVGAIAIGGGRLYYGTETGLRVYSLPTTSALFNVNSPLGETAGFGCSRIEVTPGYAYCMSSLSGDAHRLSVIDISDATHPFLAGQSAIDATHSALAGVAVDANLIAASTSDGRIAMMEMWAPQRLVAGTSGIGADYSQGAAVSNGLVMVGDDGLNFDVFRTNNPAELDAVGTFAYTALFVVTSGAGSFLRSWDEWLLYVDPTPSGRAFDVLDPHTGTPTVRANVTRSTTGSCADPEQDDVTIDAQVSGDLAYVLAERAADRVRRLEIWQLDARSSLGVWSPTCLAQLSLGSQFDKLTRVVDQTLFATGTNGDIIEISLASITVPSAPGGARVGVLTADTSGFAGTDLTIAMSSAGARTIRFVSGRNDEQTSTNDLVLLTKNVASAAAFTTTRTASGAFGTLGRAGRYLLGGDGTRVAIFSGGPVPGYVNGFFAVGNDLATLSTTASVRTPRTILPVGPYVFLFGESGLQTVRPTR